MKDVFEAMREAKERKEFLRRNRENAPDEVIKNFKRFCELVSKKMKGEK